MKRHLGTIAEELRQTRPFATAEREVAVTLLRTSDVLRHAIDHTLRPWGISSEQYNVLRILRGAHPDPLPTLDIRNRMIERMPGITRFLDQLEGRGLVRRARSAEDRRVVLCWITPAGLDLLAAMDDEVDRADEASVGRLDEDELTRLIDLLGAVRTTG